MEQCNQCRCYSDEIDELLERMYVLDKLREEAEKLDHSDQTILLEIALQAVAQYDERSES